MLTDEAMRIANPQRGEPPFTVPQARYFTVRVPFAPEDFQAAERAAAAGISQSAAEIFVRAQAVVRRR